MPKISVISIAKKDSEFEELRRALTNQTFQDFEFVTSIRGTIPEAWNDAISRAKGEFLVFTESDATPLTDKWLEEIAKFAKKKAIFKGLEINPTDLDLCNLVCDASILKKARFDESFQISEDTELFARLRKKGIRIEHINAFPVIHVPKRTWGKTLWRGFKRGMLWMKIIYLHGRDNIEDVNTRNYRGNYIHPIGRRVQIIAENILVLLGLFIGAICYLPISVKRKFARKTR